MGIQINQEDFDAIEKGFEKLRDNRISILNSFLPIPGLANDISQWLMSLSEDLSSIDDLPEEIVRHRFTHVALVLHELTHISSDLLDMLADREGQMEMVWSIVKQQRVDKITKDKKLWWRNR